MTISFHINHHHPDFHGNMYLISIDQITYLCSSYYSKKPTIIEIESSKTFGDDNNLLSLKKITELDYECEAYSTLYGLKSDQ